MAATSVGNKSTSNSSRSSSNVSIFGIIDNDDDKESHGQSSDSINLANSQKLKVTVKVKKVKEGVWRSYYHCLVAFVIINNVHYWFPSWYEKITDDLLAIHFILVTIFVQLPIYYMEMFLAQYTKEPPINLWKICPIFIGFCYSLILYSVYQSWLDAVYCSRNLLYLIDTVVYQTPWLKCPPELGDKCLVLTEQTRLSKNCTMAGNTTLIWCPDRGVFDFSTQYWYKSRYTDQSEDAQLRLDTRWKLVLCSVAHWVILMMIVSRTIYKFGTMIYCLAIGMMTYMTLNLTYAVYRMNVADLMRIVFQPPHITDFVNADLWAVVYVSALRRSHIVTPPLTMTYVAQIETKFDIAWCAIIVTIASFAGMLMKSTLHLGMMKIISDQLDVDPLILKLNNASIAMAMMPQHHGTLPMPLMWTFLWFFLRYFALLLQNSMVVESILENIFFKSKMRKEFRFYFISLFCVAGCIVNIVIIVKHSILSRIHVIYARIILTGTSLLPLVESVFIIIIYGLGVFVNDIHFHSGSPPSFFWTFCWKALPLVLLTLYLTTVSGNLNDHLPPLSTALWLLKGASLSIIPIFALKRIMHAVYNDNLVYLFNPVFDWGPADREVRKARKRFNPKTDVRSQPERTVDYVKPRDSNRDLNVQ